MERVLLADDERVGLESTYVAVARVPDLDRDFDPDSSFYAYLHDRLGIAFGDADERIETVLATPREALLIGTPPALPMLLIHRVSRDTRGGRWSGCGRCTGGPVLVHGPPGQVTFTAHLGG